MERSTPEEVVIRPASWADIDGLLDLHEAIASEGRWIAAEAPIEREERAERWRPALLRSDEGRFFVAEIDGEMIGSASAHETAPGLVYLGMSVSKDHRRRGVGTRLLEACVDWARSVGAHKVTLEVWPHNEAALALYERYGFEREGYLREHYRRKNGELWDSVVMGLRL